MRRGLVSVLAMILPLVSLIAGCGGGGDGGGGAVKVSGVAAAGAPIVGTVKLKDSSSPAKELTATIAEDGSFSFDVGGLTPPFILKATGTAGGVNYTLYSFANGAGTANINPFANLALSVSSGGFDPATVYTAPSAGMLQTIASKLPATVTDIQTRLQPLLALYDAAKANPLADTFTANHTGLDEVLDMVKVEVVAGTVTVRNKLSSAVIFTCQANNFTGSVDPLKIPVPPIRPVIAPILTTLVVKGTTTFTADVLRSVNKKVTWSVVETNGGTISDTGVYTAPSIEGIYHVKAVSVADPTWPAIATVKVVTGVPLSVAIDQTSATLAPSGSKTFTATVTGTSNIQVNWSVVETNGGSISSSGVYTAPATAGTYHVKAVSAADTTKSSTATVTVTAIAPPPITGTFPIGTWNAGKWGSFTVTKKQQTIGNADYYSGTVSYSTFSNGGNVNISGEQLSPDGFIIVSGNTLAVYAASFGSLNPTGYTFTASIDQLQGGNTIGAFIWGKLIIVNNTIGYSYDGQAPFTKTQ